MASVVQDASANQKAGAVDALYDALNEHEDDMKFFEGLPEKMLKVCMETCKLDTPRDAALNSRIAFIMERSVGFAIPRADAIGELINHESALAWAFEGAMSDYEERRVHLGGDYGQNDDHHSFHEQTVDGYRESLRWRAFETPDLDEELSMWFQEGGLFKKCIQLAGVAAMTPHILCKLITNWDWQQKDRYWREHMCIIMLRMIESALESPWALHVILGYGVLPKVAHYYSRLLIVNVTANDAAIFQSLLNLRPEFREQFRAATFDGVAGNPLTIIGNTIPQLDRAGCEYTFEYED